LDLDIDSLKKSKKFDAKGKEGISNNNNDINAAMEEIAKSNYNKLKEIKEKKNRIMEKNKNKIEEEHLDKIEKGERLANKNMLKSRGIYRKRKQYQGNAKVHNREKFMKKEKIRKNMVKEYSSKPDVYIGETTGIRRDLIRSTKFK